MWLNQIYIALISYLLIELTTEPYLKDKVFKSGQIRICLVYYLSLDYVCNQVEMEKK
jgi:hypothetical protein